MSRLIVQDANEDATPDEADRLTNEELNTLSSLLFLAGFETTTNLIGNGVISLLSQPDQMDALRADPELCANVADELLRHDGTVQLAGRFATTDVAFGDVTIPAGDPIFVMLGAANRDPDRYPDPDRIDFTRTKIQPLAFGGGVHLCLGAPLARLEIEIVFRKLSERFATLELGDELPPHRDRLTLRSPTAVPLKLRPRPTPRVAPLAARPAGDDTQWRIDYRRHVDEQVGRARRRRARGPHRALATGAVLRALLRRPISRPSRPRRTRSRSIPASTSAWRAATPPTAT